MTDEVQEKASRNEFVEVFTAGSQAMLGLAGQGPQGAKLAGALLKFQLAPYRAGRELGSIIDEYIEAAPEIAEKMQAAQGGDTDGLVEAQNKLAEAETIKAQAAMAGVQAKSELDKAEMQRKMGQMQMDAQKQQTAAQEAQAKLQLQLDKQTRDADDKDAKTAAEIDLMRAKIAEILNSIGLDVRKQELAEYTTASNEQARQVDQQMAAEGQAVDQQFRERGEERADRGQDFSERSGDRQMSLAEQQALRSDDDG